MTKNTSIPTTTSCSARMSLSLLSNNNSNGALPTSFPLPNVGQQMTPSRLNAILNQALALIDDDDFCDDEQD